MSVATIRLKLRMAFEQAPIPRCACGRPVGAGNEIRETVGGWGGRGGLITGCQTCTGDRRL